MNIFKRQKLFLLCLILVFFFRLGVGLCAEFRAADNDSSAGDERQIYLIGLKFYTTGQWPYFGPDVNPPRFTTTRQLPGALQGLVVGLPFYVLPIAEAPYILLNILSFSSLCLLAWYCTKRLPDLPEWLVWLWLMSAPWTLDVSTQVFNPSYVLPGSIIFFVGVLETYPSYSKHLIKPEWASFMMGIALFWVMQFHMSWLIMVPYVIASFYFQCKSAGKRALIAALYFTGGAALTGAFMLPTFIKYGIVEGLGGTTSAIKFNLANSLKIFDVPVRFLTFASYIVFDARMIGSSTAEALGLFQAQPWILPFALFVSVVGILQVMALILLWFTKKPGINDWQPIKYLTLLTVCLIYTSFLFTVRKPFINTFYVALPIAMIYSLYCWNEFLRSRRRVILATIFLVCGIIFHLGLAVHNLTERSLYRERSIIQAAIDDKDYHKLGERRVGAKY